MALIGNRSVLNKSPGRFLNAGVANLRSGFSKHGMVRSAAYSALAATPNGHLSPSAWVLPRTSGGMSSINFTTATVSGSGLAVGGVTTTGTSSITLTFADAAGQLIASGGGTAAFSLTSNNPLLTASINGTGTAVATFSTNTPTLGALADGSGEVAITLTATNSGRMPANDASPLRSGTAAISVTGALTPYAIGEMAGTTAEAGLTNAGIANSVWSKIVESGFSAEQILRIIAAQAAGSATGLENGNPQFTGLDGVTVRIDGAYSAGTRTIDSLNGD